MNEASSGGAQAFIPHDQAADRVEPRHRALDEPAPPPGLLPAEGPVPSPRTSHVVPVPGVGFPTVSPLVWPG
jgi:hypothetical protein